MRLILPVVLMLPTLVQAETVLDLPYLQSAETRFGTLSVGPVQLDGYDGKQLLLDGQPIDGPRDAYVDIQAVLPMPDGDAQDWVLVSVAGGGNACPTLFAFVAVSAKGAHATEPFGTCSEGVLDLRQTESAFLALDMVGLSDGDAMLHTFTFDGYAVSEIVSPLP